MRLTALFGTKAPHHRLNNPLPDIGPTTRERLSFDTHCKAIPRKVMARADWAVPALISQAAQGATTHSIDRVEDPADMPFDSMHVAPFTKGDAPCDSLQIDEGATLVDNT